jgi:hypothetical protein
MTFHFFYRIVECYVNAMFTSSLPIYYYCTSLSNVFPIVDLPFALVVIFVLFPCRESMISHYTSHVIALESLRLKCVDHDNPLLYSNGMY